MADLVEKGTWVEISRIVLAPGERAPPGRSPPPAGRRALPLRALAHHGAVDARRREYRDP